MKKLFLLITLCILVFFSSANNYQKPREIFNNNSSELKANTFFKNRYINDNKSAENPYKLDSIIYKDGTKEVFNYDESGNTTKYYYYEKSLNQDTQLKELVEFDYEDDNVVLFKFSALDEDNQLMVLEQSEKIYDSDGRQTTEIYWTMGEKELEPFSFNFSTHSVDSSAMSSYFWNLDSKNWELSNYEISYYDLQGRIKQLDAYRKEIGIGVLELRNRILYYYDSKGRQTSHEFLSAPFINGIWEREMAFSYEFDTNDRVKNSIYYRKKRGLMETWFKEIFYYNNEGLTEIIDCFSGTDSINNSLEYKIEYQYENNSLSGQFESLFDKEAGELKPYCKYEFKHDKTVDTTDLILPYLEGPDYYYERNSLFNGDYFKESVLKSFIKYENDTLSGQLVKKYEASYFYSRLKPDNTSSTELSDKSFKCSPNPFTENISVNLSEKSDYMITIYDLTGKIKYKDHISGSNININPEISEKGIYILELRSGKGKIYRSKIIRK
ncbi:MAG: T9SS type A sorting domain-containing protein [Prolixibacteraceae bacterium]|nr:T9SS type A sorting domain-containing protein [Prolixibacteraceae bacterium]